MKLKEVAGSGSFESCIINETVFEWDVERNASFPAKVTFRYTLPTHYTHGSTKESFRLPSTYHAHLSGVPGFSVDISYAVVVYMERNRHKTNWWRKSSRQVQQPVFRSIEPFAHHRTLVYGCLSLIGNYLVPRKQGRFRPAL
jgi:hypothetical protein